MKVLFAHDHVFYKYKDSMYSTGGLSNTILKRYTTVFDEVTVISRQKVLSSNIQNLTLASTKNVHFVKVPDFKKIRGMCKIFEAKRIIRNEVENCDALIARLPSSIGALAVKYAKRLNKPYLVELVACPWDAYWNHSLIGKFVAPFVYLTTKKRVWNSKYVIYVTNEFLQRRYPTQGESVNCSNVSLKEFNDNILEKRLNKIRSMDRNSKIVIGTTAAVNVRYKGQQYIIKALGKLKKEGYTNFEYQLVGGGDQTYLKKIAKKNNVLNQVKFLGSLPHNEVFKWLNTIDIYVQPSRQEGLPRALIEAMSQGVPAFGANTAGIPELLEKEYIFSNTNKNIEEICDILKKFDKQAMEIQAKRNYFEAKKYDSNIIEKRRNEFFKRFAYEK